MKQETIKLAANQLKQDRAKKTSILWVKADHDITAPSIPSKHFEMYPLIMDDEEESDKFLINKPIIFKQPRVENKPVGPGQYEVDAAASSFQKYNSQVP